MTEIIFSCSPDRVNGVDISVGYRKMLDMWATGISVVEMWSKCFFQKKKIGLNVKNDPALMYYASGIRTDFLCTHKPGSDTVQSRAPLAVFSNPPLALLGDFDSWKCRKLHRRNNYGKREHRRVEWSPSEFSPLSFCSAPDRIALMPITPEQWDFNNWKKENMGIIHLSLSPSPINYYR